MRHASCDQNRIYALTHAWCGHALMCTKTKLLQTFHTHTHKTPGCPVLTTSIASRQLSLRLSICSMWKQNPTFEIRQRRIKGFLEICQKSVQKQEILVLGDVRGSRLLRSMFTKKAAFLGNWASNAHEFWHGINDTVLAIPQRKLSTKCHYARTWHDSSRFVPVLAPLPVTSWIKPKSLKWFQAWFDFRANLKSATNSMLTDLKDNKHALSA